MDVDAFKPRRVIFVPYEGFGYQADVESMVHEGMFELVPGAAFPLQVALDNAKCPGRSTSFVGTPRGGFLVGVGERSDFWFASL